MEGTSAASTNEAQKENQNISSVLGSQGEAPESFIPGNVPSTPVEETCCLKPSAFQTKSSEGSLLVCDSKPFVRKF